MQNQGGWAAWNSADYYKRIQQERERLRVEQAKIDSITDPQQQLEARRRRYKKKHTPLEAIPAWPAQAPALRDNPTHTTVMKRPAPVATTGMYPPMFQRADPIVDVPASETVRRCEVNPQLNSKVSVYQGDITCLEIDAIVNAANQSLMGGGGIDGAIHSAAGELLDEECEKLGRCETGCTKMSRGYLLPAKYVLHTVGPIDYGDKKLRLCYESILALVKEHRLRTVALCCVSTGVFGFPLVRATRIALRTVRRWLETDGNADLVDRIIFCTYRDVEMEVYEKLLPSYFPIEGFPVAAASPEKLKKEDGEEEEDTRVHPDRPAFSGRADGFHGGWDSSDYYKRIQQERERLRVEQTKIDSITDPQQQLEARRRCYKKKHTPLEAIPAWPAQAPALRDNPAHTTVMKRPAPVATTGMYPPMFQRADPIVDVPASETVRRCEVNPQLNSKVSVYQGDITCLEIDAIVNAANQSLMGGGGIDGAIHSAAGELLDEECEKLGRCETGCTKMSRGYLLPAKFVLHTVGPIDYGDKKLRLCYESILALVKEHRLRTVALCCVSTGVFGFPLVRATRIALRTVRRWLETDGNADLVDRIIFCTYRDVEMEVYEKLLPSYFPIEGFPVAPASPEMLKKEDGEEEEDTRLHPDRPAFAGGVTHGGWC